MILYSPETLNAFNYHFFSIDVTSWKLTLSRHEYQLSQTLIMKFKLCLAKLLGMFLTTVLALQK